MLRNIHKNKCILATKGYLSLSPISESFKSVMLSSMAWMSGYSNKISLSVESDDLTSCRYSAPISPVGSEPPLRVISTNPLTASPKAFPFFSLISTTRLVSLFFWDTRPPSAWPTADRRLMTLPAKRCAEGWRGAGPASWLSCSSSMLLIDSESSSSDGGWSKDEGLGGGNQTPSSIQDTLCGDWGTGLLWRCCSGVPGVVGVERLPVLALWGMLHVKSRLGLLRTTSVGVCGMRGESADLALVRPAQQKNHALLN